MEAVPAIMSTGLPNGHTYTRLYTHTHTHRIIATVRLDASTKPGPFNYIYKHSLRALAVSLEQTLRDTLLCVCVCVCESVREGVCVCV